MNDYRQDPRYINATPEQRAAIDARAAEIQRVPNRGKVLSDLAKKQAKKYVYRQGKKYLLNQFDPTHTATAESQAAWNAASGATPEIAGMGAEAATNAIWNTAMTGTQAQMGNMAAQLAYQKAAEMGLTYAGQQVATPAVQSAAQVFTDYMGSLAAEKGAEAMAAPVYQTLANQGAGAVGEVVATQVAEQGAAQGTSAAAGAAGSSIGNYAIPVIGMGLAAVMSYNAKKRSGKDIKRWSQLGREGYQYTPADAYFYGTGSRQSRYDDEIKKGIDPNFVGYNGEEWINMPFLRSGKESDLTSGDLKRNPMMGKIFGNAYQDVFTDEQRDAISKEALKSVREHHGGLQFDEKGVAQFADNMLRSEGQQGFASARLAEKERRRQLHIMDSRGKPQDFQSDDSGGENQALIARQGEVKAEFLGTKPAGYEMTKEDRRAVNLEAVKRERDKYTLSADWMPEDFNSGDDMGANWTDDARKQQLMNKALDMFKGGKANTGGQAIDPQYMSDLVDRRGMPAQNLQNVPTQGGINEMINRLGSGSGEVQTMPGYVEGYTPKNGNFPQVPSLNQSQQGFTNWPQELPSNNKMFIPDRIDVQNPMWTNLQQQSPTQPPMVAPARTEPFDANGNRLRPWQPGDAVYGKRNNAAEATKNFVAQKRRK